MIVRLRSGVALVIALTAVLPCATGWTANPAVLELARRKIPATSGTTTADIVRMRENLFRRLTLEAYQAVGHRDPAWDADAVKLIEDYLGFLTGAPDGETSTRLIERSGKLLQSGCDDALIKLIHADMLRCENLEGAEPALIAAQQSLGSASYPHALSRFAAHSLASIYWRNSYHRRTELNAALDAFVLETGACLKAGEYREGEERVLLAILLNDWSGVLLERHQEVARAISEALGAESWLARVIDGECQIDLAWKSRTSGWAHQVSEEGWMGFSEHLDK
jgi:hypothetical protein